MLFPVAVQALRQDSTSGHHRFSVSGRSRIFHGIVDRQSDYKFEKHPVLNFNMAYGEISTSDDHISRIKRSLRKHVKQKGIRLTPVNFIEEMFEDLLQDIYDKYGLGAVILVDEHDYTVTKYVSNSELALCNRNVLQDFYQLMKSNIKFIRFAFVTGITRFAMTSLESGPNNFTDICLMSEFAGICGFTIKEFNMIFRNRFS
jgi:hypothetical protein